MYYYYGDDDVAVLLRLYQSMRCLVQQQVSLLTTQLYDFKRQLRQAEESLKQKDAELEAMKRKAAVSSTPDSYSIGEKVDTPAFTTPMNSAATNDSTEEDLADAWDDDW